MLRQPIAGRHHHRITFDRRIAVLALRKVITQVRPAGRILNRPLGIFGYEMPHVSAAGPAPG